MSAFSYPSMVKWKYERKSREWAMKPNVRFCQGILRFLTNHAHRHSGNIPSPTMHKEYVKSNTMISHVHNPELNIHHRWLFCHWLQKNLLGKASQTLRVWTIKKGFVLRAMDVTATLSAHTVYTLPGGNNFHWRRWGSSLPGLCIWDPLLSPPINTFGDWGAHAKFQNSSCLFFGSKVRSRNPTSFLLLRPCKISKL